MKRTSILVTVLCLAVVALGIGAGPALAADGCTCHTADPPTATAAHAPLVVGVDCTTCHADWLVPHPDVGPAGLLLSSRTTASGFELEGMVGAGSVFAAIGHPDVVVYLQQRLWGASVFTDLTQVTTGAQGGYGFTVPSPAPFAAYRAIAQGHVGPLLGGGTRLFEPAVKVLRPKPVVSLRLVNLSNGAVRLGRAVRASGTVKPPDLGGTVRIVVHKRLQSGAWHLSPRLGGEAVISAAGTYSWKFTPRSRGLFRVRASVAGRSETRSASSRWRQVLIK